jgi:hypothetical protein
MRIIIHVLSIRKLNQFLFTKNNVLLFHLHALLQLIAPALGAITISIDSVCVSIKTLLALFPLVVLSPPAVIVSASDVMCFEAV